MFPVYAQKRAIVPKMAWLNTDKPPAVALPVLNVPLVYLVRRDQLG
jgi:hypothetical protein